MPELPEVETTVRALRSVIIGKSIKRVEILRPNMINHSRSFATNLRDRTIHSIHRRGKYMLTDIGENQSLLLHLRMSGRLGIRKPHEPELTYERIRFHLNDGNLLIFNDPRTLGRAMIIDSLDHPLLASMGPDALEIPEATFIDAIRRKRGPVKVVLLDQRFVAGIGNIYAQEACFLARIDPRRSGLSLSRKEASAFWNAMRETLERGIAKMGTSFSDFADLFGKPGQNQTSLWVYGRKGKKCRECGNLIEALTQAQRTTAWCRRCQR